VHPNFCAGYCYIFAIQGSIGKWKRCNFDIPFKEEIVSSFQYHVKLSRKGYRSLIYRSINTFNYIYAYCYVYLIPCFQYCIWHYHDTSSLSLIKVYEKCLRSVLKQRKRSFFVTCIVQVSYMYRTLIYVEQWNTLNVRGVYAS